MKKLFSLLCLLFCVAFVSASSYQVQTCKSDHGIVKTEIVAISNVSQDTLATIETSAPGDQVRSTSQNVNDKYSKDKEATKTKNVHPLSLPEDVGWHVESQK